MIEYERRMGTILNNHTPEEIGRSLAEIFRGWRPHEEDSRDYQIAERAYKEGIRRGYKDVLDKLNELT